MEVSKDRGPEWGLVELHGTREFVVDNTDFCARVETGRNGSVFHTDQSLHLRQSLHVRELSRRRGAYSDSL